MSVFRIGHAVEREEDLRQLKGRGRYIDDVVAVREAHAYVLRSPFAHADIRSIDVEAARTAPGVLAVLTGDDLTERGLGSIKPANPGKRASDSAILESGSLPMSSAEIASTMVDDVLFVSIALTRLRRYEP